MDLSGAVRVLADVETEQRAHRVTPVRAIPRGVEQAHVQRHVRAIVRREYAALRRFVLEGLLRHMTPWGESYPFRRGVLTIIRGV